jgi:hypothetical protein
MAEPQLDDLEADGAILGFGLSPAGRELFGRLAELLWLRPLTPRI